MEEKCRKSGERVSLKEAAKLLGRNEQYIRLHLRDGSLREIGDAKPPAYEGGHWSYDIYRKRLEKYIAG